MPSGKLCRGMALRNQRFCRAHSPTPRVAERANSVQNMVERLAVQVAAMNTAELLDFLLQKLERLQKSFNRFPDVRFTLIFALDRIDQITRMESAAKQQFLQNQMLLQQIRKYQLESGTYPQDRLNHELSPASQP
jgi:hypothetical protein